MSKLEGYLQYEEAYNELMKEMDFLDDECEKALESVNQDREYYNSVERNILDELAKVKEKKRKLQNDKRLIQRCFNDEKQNIEKCFVQDYDAYFVSVTIRDFKKELASLAEVSEEDIDVKIKFSEFGRIEVPGKIDNVQDVLRLSVEEFCHNPKLKSWHDLPIAIYVEYEYQNHSALIEITKRFSYIEADGRTLLEHCVPYSYRIIPNYYVTKLIFGEDIDDILINISFKDLVSDFKNHLYMDLNEKQLIKKVILNILEKQNKNVVKIKEL